jgi:preprotein translocase subunit SecD
MGNPSTDLHPPLFSGDQVASASIGADQTGQRTVDFVLKDQGRQLFADYTSDHVGDYFAIVLDGEVISAPVINDAILGGEVQVSQGAVGGYPLAEAQKLVTILRFGQLPFPLQEVSSSE